MVDEISTLKGNIMIADDFNIHWDNATNKEKLEFADFPKSHNLNMWKNKHIQKVTQLI